MWCHTGISEVDTLFGEGVAAIERQELETAERIFGRLIQRAPEFAEGWNKRATVRYLRGDYTGAISDCQETLDRKPHHFGALSGQGLCHIALGQFHEAADLFRRTLAVHPHLAAARQNLAAVLGEMIKGNGHATGGG
jgi:Flp pilus assembly protein TadD